MWRQSEGPLHQPQSDLLTGRYVSAIDGLRAIAVLAVVLYHVDPTWVPGGFAGVDIFFVISGFVVSLASSTLDRTRFSRMVSGFYRRRVIRIVPALLVVIMATQVLSVLVIPALPKRSWDGDWTGLASIFGLANVQLWRTSAGYFSAGPDLNPYTHMWSLGVEEQFYLLFPLLGFWLLYRPKHTARGAAVVAVLSLASLLAAALSDQTFAFYMVFTRFWELGTGVLLWALLSRYAPPRRLSAVIAITGTGLLAAGLLASDPLRFPWPLALLSVAGTALLIVSATAFQRDAPARALALPALRHFGQISYSLYLWHWPVVVLLRWTAGLNTLPLKLLALSASWALGYLSYRMIENPLRQNRFVRTAQPVSVITVGLVAMGLVAVGIPASIKLRPAITLSVTGDRQVWSMTEQGPGTRGCTVSPTTQGAGQVFKPSHCAAAPVGRTLFIVGDSHAIGYHRVSGNLARDHGLQVLNFAETGCAVLPAMPPLPSCAEFTARALGQVVRQARPGDWLFLPGLRVDRLIDQRQAANPLHPYREQDLRAFATNMRPLLDRGVAVILEAPKPVYAIAPMRCADWFNRSNPACRAASLSAAALHERGKMVAAAWIKLQHIDPRFRVFDPFPTLCPGPVCTPFLGTMPVTYDGDHLSAAAQDLLTRPLAQFLLKGSPGSRITSAPIPARR